MTDKEKNAQVIAVLQDPKTCTDAVEEIFEKLDKDKSGFIEQSEFRASMFELAKKLNAPEPTESEITQTLNSIDSNKDGKISKKEMEDLVRFFLDLIIQDLA